jgi:hypothetical protein
VFLLISDTAAPFGPSPGRVISGKENAPPGPSERQDEVVSFDNLADNPSYLLICHRAQHERQLRHGAFINKKSALHFEHIMDRSVSDSAQSTDSGIILNDLLEQSTETGAQNDLSRLFRLEGRSIVCASANIVCYIGVLTRSSDWRIGRTRNRPGAHTFAIWRGRGGH